MMFLSIICNHKKYFSYKLDFVLFPSPFEHKFFSAKVVFLLYFGSLCLSPVIKSPLDSLSAIIIANKFSVGVAKTVDGQATLES